MKKFPQKTEKEPPTERASIEGSAQAAHHRRHRGEAVEVALCGSGGQSERASLGVWCGFGAHGLK